MIITKTPYRISFFGGGSDYPEWYKKYGGMVLSTTIDKYIYISCRYLPKFFKHKYRIVWSKIENVTDINQIQHRAVKKLLEHLKVKQGLEIHYDGDLPARSGMGSSSCFAVGLSKALYKIKGQELSKQQLAKKTIEFEQKIMREVVGSQDQTIASYGGFNKIIFSKNHTKVIPLDISMRDLISDYLVLFYYPKTRLSSNIQEAHVKNIQSNIETLNHMNKLSEEALVAIDNKDALFAFFEAQEEDYEPNFVFPINLDLGDGEILTVNSLDELEEAFDECEDDFECFELIFPISMVDDQGNNVVINSEEELFAFLDAQGDNYEPAVLYPIEVLIDDETVSITSDDEMEELYEDDDEDDGDGDVPAKLLPRN